MIINNGGSVIKPIDRMLVFRDSTIELPTKAGASIVAEVTYDDFPNKNVGIKVAGGTLLETSFFAAYLATQFDRAVRFVPNPNADNPAEVVVNPEGTASLNGEDIADLDATEQQQRIIKKSFKRIFHTRTIVQKSELEVGSLALAIAEASSALTGIDPSALTL